MNPRAFVGCSGFSYQHWRGLFYPASIKQSEWFDYYQRFFDTVEMNVTFYRMPRKSQFAKWYRDSLPGFRFSVKGSRFITHIKRLNVEKDSIEKFFGSVSELKEKLSVVLWQFPPNMKIDINRLKGFIGLIKDYQVRQVFEFRHISWCSKEIIQLLNKHNMAICMADWPDFNKQQPITADFVYIRRHGVGGSYSSCYTDDELAEDARAIEGFLKKGLDVYIYFNNDYNAYAPKNALKLKEFLS